MLLLNRREQGGICGVKIHRLTWL